MKKLNLLVAICTLFIMGSLSAQPYTVDTEKSTLKWVGSKITGTHSGDVKISEGRLSNNEGKFMGEFTILL